MLKKLKVFAAAILVMIMALVILTSCGRDNDYPEDEDTPTATPAPDNQDNQDGADATQPVAGFDVSTADTLTITVLGNHTDINPRAPGNDILQPIWREMTRVIPDIVEYDEGAIGWAQFFQMHHLGGTMPMVLTGAFAHSEAQMAQREFEIMRPITYEEIRTYLPRTVARLEDLGVDVRMWYEANLDPVMGVLTHIPNFPNLALTNLRHEPEVSSDNSHWGYNWWFRDDILQMVFPEVRTEQELLDLYIAQGGNLTFDQVDDVPIHNLDDLLEFLRAVQALDITVDGQPIVPGQIQLNEDIGSLMWSAFSMMDLFWHTLADRTYNFADRTYHYFAGTTNWRNYIQFMNVAFNEGLIHPETFIMLGDQRDAMVANGQFAMWQSWLGVDAARETARARGETYGFRQLNLFPVESFVNQYQDASMRVISLRGWGEGYGITYALPEEHFAQVMNWIDWNQSLEAAELRAWGLPHMSTGTGRDRRFTAEYRDLELWWLTGQSGPEFRDGIYFGMSRGGPFTRSNPETNTAWLAGGWNYFPNPLQAYPRDISDPDAININDVADMIRREHVNSLMNFYAEGALSPEVVAARAAYEHHNSTAFVDIKHDYSFDSPGGRAAIIAAIVGSVGDFDANYQIYLDRFVNVQRFQDVLSEEMRLYFAWMELYVNYLVPLQ